MVDIKKYENCELCTKCGGYCCQKCGCDYFISDIPSFKIDDIEKLLDTHKVSIVAYLNFQRLNDGKLVMDPILYLRARNVNRDAIDLFSLKTRCSALKEDGCSYNLANRPSGGVHLIPKENHICCSDINEFAEILKWKPYQKVLAKIVKKRTGKNVLVKLSEDIEKFFYDLIMNNFKDVQYEELLDIKCIIPNLLEIYGIEFNSAIEKGISAKRVKAIS